jgi:hypothetical protein
MSAASGEAERRSKALNKPLRVIGWYHSNPCCRPTSVRHVWRTLTLAKKRNSPPTTTEPCAAAAAAFFYFGLLP